jgi:hypothetical protein
MTRRYTCLASLTLLAATLAACDAAPEQTPADEAIASEPDAQAPAPAAEDDADDEQAEDADDAEEPVCVPPAPARPRVMFVLDKSSSMTGDGVETGATVVEGSPTRWGQLHALVGELALGMEEEALMGAVLFPSSYAETSDTLCDVRSVPEAGLGPYRAADLLKRLPPADAEGFRGGSPAQAAYATALDHLDRAGETAPSAIVLITDGGINCAADESPLGSADRDFVDLVAFARESLQIQTFVIGVDVAPGEQKLPYLDPDVMLREIALAGGTARGERGYFAVGEAQPLVEALTEFVGHADVTAAATACP